MPSPAPDAERRSFRSFFFYATRYMPICAVRAAMRKESPGIAISSARPFSLFHEVV
jgi:hypothetical protein